MNQQLNAAFVVQDDGQTAFFLWATNVNGSFARKINSELTSYLAISTFFQQLIQDGKLWYGTLTMEKENGTYKTDGVFIPMETFFDVLLDEHHIKELAPWFWAGPSIRFFKEIAQACKILIENGHYRPDLLLIEKGEMTMIGAHWLLDKSLLEEAGLIANWLHHIPEEVLAPEVIAQQSLNTWMAALIDTWADKIIRQKFRTALQLEMVDWPNQHFFDSDWAEWFYFLVNGSGDFYQWTKDPAVREEYLMLKEEIRAFSGNWTPTVYDQGLSSFKASYIVDNIEPLSMGLRFEPLDRAEPFYPGGIWEVDLIIDAENVLTGDKERLALGEFTKRKPQWKDWSDERLQFIKTLNPKLRELAVYATRLSTDEVLGIYSRRDELADRGILCLFPEWLKIKDRRKQKATMQVSVGASSGVFSFDAIIDFNWRLSLGEYDISAKEFEKLVLEQQRFLRRGDEWVELPLDQLNAMYAAIRASQTTLKKKATFSDALRLSLSQKENDAVAVKMAPNVAAFLESIVTKPNYNLDEPDGLQGKLRPYQKRGYTWLTHLRKMGVGGCLADDMGLGKTIQTIAYLLKEKEEKSEYPALIVCPTSVIGNWARELHTFAPSLRVYIHHGQERLNQDDFRKKAKDMDVVITSYNLMVKDADWMREVVWSSLILDEAQAIKNPMAKKSQQLRRFKAEHRLALTGTPIENRLEELWSIMDFLNPGYLGSLTAFRREFITPIEARRDEAKAELLQKLIRPFLLRREKTDKRIIRDLPEKDELKIYCHLKEEQASLYQSIVDRLMEQMSGATGIQRKGLILSALTKLKQVCNHPELLAGKNVIGRTSGKMERFLQLLQPIVDNHERALVFTQYVKMGELLIKEIQHRFPGCAIYFLNGAVPMKKRDEMIKAFQNETREAVFILSLRAGGFGLNLTNANHVIHYDRWWNPAVEEQATDRTYRIGQRRNVHVYKLIAEGTLEKRIDDLIEQKKGLADRIIGSGDAWITEMDDRDVYNLIRLREKVLA